MTQPLFSAVILSLCGAIWANALQLRWILKHADDPREVDNRVYVFAPGRGAVSVR